MNSKLTKAAHLALEPCPLTWAIQRINSTPYSLTKDECVEVLRGLRDEIRALTQRPAAQTEREAFEAEMRQRCDSFTIGDFDWDEAQGQYIGTYMRAAYDGWQARASLTAPQQATPDQAQDISAGSVEPGSALYEVTHIHRHKTLKTGDLVRMTEDPRYNNLLLRTDHTLHTLEDEHGQYVHLRSVPMYAQDTMEQGG